MERGKGRTFYERAEFVDSLETKGAVSVLLQWRMENGSSSQSHRHEAGEANKVQGKIALGALDFILGMMGK